MGNFNLLNFEGFGVSVQYNRLANQDTIGSIVDRLNFNAAYHLAEHMEPQVNRNTPLSSIL